MSEQIKCPVCNKVGIPDYHKEEVVCPCCGTDLSIYKMLSDSLERQTAPKKTTCKIWRIATAGSITITLVVIVLLCIKQTEVGYMRQENASLTNSVSILTSKLESADKEMERLKKQVEKALPSDDVYIVQKNDSPCKISKKLYGTERRYKEIEAKCSRLPMQPGDTLRLK